MFVYRLASRHYTPDNSEGARLYGGRWNLPGTPVIYASAYRSLAALEVIAHRKVIPLDFRITVIEVPDTLLIELVELKDLPDGWPEEQSVMDTAAYGTDWARSQRTPILRVPSAAVRAEYNYILNPLHPDFKAIRFEVPDTEHIDRRLRSST